MAQQTNNGGGLSWVIAGLVVVGLFASNSGSTSDTSPTNYSYTASAALTPEPTDGSAYAELSDVPSEPEPEPVTFADVEDEIAALPSDEATSNSMPSTDDAAWDEGQDYASVEAPDEPIASSLTARPVGSSAYSYASPDYAAPSTARAGCGENGSCYGDISAATGRPRTVYVRGYTRRDGTYVRSHYRSRPRR